MNDPFGDWDGAYVLGALSADDRHRYEEHLAGCAECARAVQDLVALPGILGELDVAEAVAIRDTPDDAGLRAAAHSPGRTAAVARRIGRRRRRVRLVATGALVVVLAVGGLTGWAIGAAGGGSVQLAATRQMHAVGESHLTAALSVTPVGWGTRLDWSCDYRGATAVPPSSAAYTEPVTYRLVVRTKDGAEHTVATWTSEGGEARHLVAATAIPEDSMARIEIRATGSSGALAEASL